MNSLYRRAAAATGALPFSKLVDEDDLAAEEGFTGGPAGQVASGALFAALFGAVGQVFHGESHRSTPQLLGLVGGAILGIYAARGPQSDQGECALLDHHLVWVCSWKPSFTFPSCSSRHRPACCNLSWSYGIRSGILLPCSFDCLRPPGCQPGSCSGCLGSSVPRQRHWEA